MTRRANRWNMEWAATRLGAAVMMAAMLALPGCGDDDDDDDDNVGAGDSTLVVTVPPASAQVNLTGPDGF